MKKFGAWAVGMAVVGFASCWAGATTYPGNGNTGFGGPVGLGSLTLTDDGTTVSGTFNKGTNGLNDALVLYIDSQSGGFSDTSSFADNGDQLRQAISGFDGGSNRSTLTFPSGFNADYAIAMDVNPSSGVDFGGLWGLASGGANSLPFGVGVGVSPNNDVNASSYTFSFPLSAIGNPTSFGVFGTYVSLNGYRSSEFIAGDATGTQGWNAFTGTSSGSYAIPEPSSAALLLMGVGGLLARGRRKA